MPSAADAALIVTASAGFLTAAGAIYSTRGKVRVDKVNAQTVEQHAVTEAVETLQEVYRVMTSDLREQVRILVEREQDCRAELAQTKADVRQLRTTTAENAQAIEHVKTQLSKEPPV